jgi:putative transposase
MARRMRIQYPGALYHITSRGNRRARIFADDRDHLIWLDLLAKAVEQYSIVAHAYVHMPNHYHLIVETPDPNLSAAIHHLNGHYAQTFNKRHKLSGHLYQGRFHAQPIERQTHLLELTRYIALNPVRAELVENAEDWRWSSHASICGVGHSLSCISNDWLLSQFEGCDRSGQIAAYRAFVAQGKGLRNPLLVNVEQSNPLRTLLTLKDFAARHPERRQAMREALKSGAYAIEEIAKHFGVSIRTVQRAAHDKER